MKHEVVLVGGDHIGAAKLALADMGHVIVANDGVAAPLQQQERIVITNPYPKELKAYGAGFICKGKHRYIETDGIWKCQCGRKL